MPDMPMSRLRTYRGSTPRPADFDAYWTRALRELRRVEADVALRPSDFQTPFAECSDLYFTGVRNARLHARYLRPLKARAPHPAVLYFHGYGGAAGCWTDYLGYAAAGFSVAVIDCRGQTGASEDPGGVKGPTIWGHIVRGLQDEPDNLMLRQIYLDCAQLAGVVMRLPGVDPRRVGVYGGSQGGGLAIACAALEPRIARAVSVFPFLSDFKRSYELGPAPMANDEVRTFFKRYDPHHRRDREIFRKLGYVDVQHLAPRIRARVLMAITLQDTCCPPSTQFAIYNRLRAPKQVVLYRDFGHEDLPDFNDQIYQFMLELL